jgi:hypothetical protein
MAAAEVGLKSPLIPLFQRGAFSVTALTPLWKRGEGKILAATLPFSLHMQTKGIRALELVGQKLPMSSEA